MIVRTGIPSDKDQLAALHAASWRSAYRGLVPDAALGAPIDENMRGRWATWPEDRMILVAEAEDRILGFASVVPGTPPLLDNLHADPAARGSGVGTALMRALAQRLGRHGLRLSVLEGNAQARAFYQRLGGTEGDVEPHMFLGHPTRYLAVTWNADQLAALAAEGR